MFSAYVCTLFVSVNDKLLWILPYQRKTKVSTDLGQKWMCVSVSAEWVWGNWFTQGDRLWGTEDIYFGERICFRKTGKKSGIAFSLTEGAMPFRCKLWFIWRKICILKCILELKNSLLRDMLFLYFLAEKWRCDMAVSYKILFHLLIEKNMTNSQL